MVDCLLCLESNKDVLECIQVESEQWEELSVKKLIDKHLWPIDTITSKSCLCSTCWEELKDFHKFYTRIEVAHSDFKSLLKLETDPIEEENKPNDLFSANLLEPEIVIGQPLDMGIVIKQEYEEPTILHPDDVTNDDKEKSQDTSGDDRDFHDDSDESSDESENSDSENDLPLIHHIKNKSTKNTKSSNKTEKDDDSTKPDPLQQTDEKKKPKSKSTPKNKSTTRRKSSYTPKTSRLEYDQFLQKHFKLSCNKCQKPFDKFRMLTKHYSTEHKERGFVVCCQTKFFKRQFLVDHINYHLDPEYFKCTHCEKVFTKRRCLIGHLKTHEEMKYCCEVCNKKFVEKSRLDRHVLTHMPEEDKKHPCNECGKFFANEYLLTLHHRSVHLNIYAKICEICGQTMPDSYTFKCHMEKHDPTKPTITYKCDECGLILSGKRTLKRHKDLKHPVDGKHDYVCEICLKVSPNMKALKKHIHSMHEAGYNYKCTLCEKAFKRSDNLKEHMSTHTGEPLYHCPWCPMEFYSNGNMHNHRKKAHPVEWEEARRKKYSGNLPPNSKPVSYTASNVYQQPLETIVKNESN